MSDSYTSHCTPVTPSPTGVEPLCLQRGIVLHQVRRVSLSRRTCFPSRLVPDSPVLSRTVPTTGRPKPLLPPPDRRSIWSCPEYSPLPEPEVPSFSFGGFRDFGTSPSSVVGNPFYRTPFHVTSTPPVAGEVSGLLNWAKRTLGVLRPRLLPTECGCTVPRTLGRSRETGSV